MQVLVAEYVLPISSEPIRNGAVVFDGDTIIAVGTSADIVTQYPHAAHEDLGRAAILPGFVNCHSHLEITAMRGLLDAVEHDFTAWLLRLTATREKRLDGADIRLAAIAGAVEGAAAGVTCFGDIGRDGRPGIEALKAAGLRGIVHQETSFSPDSRTAGEDFAALREKIDATRTDETVLVKVGVSPHSPYTVSGKLFSLIADLAGSDALSVTIHASESQSEDQLMRECIGPFTGVYKKYGVSWDCPRTSPIRFLETTGILGTSPLLAHCVYVSDDDIGILANTSASVAHCPKSNAKFGHGIAPLEKLLAAGVSVGLGSDSVASNNMCDLIEEARFAALSARVRNGSSRFIGAKEILKIATLGGARAMRMDSVIGSLEAGKQADLAVISLDAAGQSPINDIEAAIVFSSSGRDVTRTIVAGETVYRGGRSTKVEHADLVAELEKMRAKMAT